MKKSQLIKQKLVQIGEFTTSHALPNIIRTDKPIIKLMWTLLLIAACAACSIFVRHSVVEYFRYETNSKIQIKTNSSLLFPTITLCSSGFSQKQKAFDLLMQHFSKLNEIKTSFKNLNDLRNFYENRFLKLEKDAEIFNKIIASNNYSNEFKRSLFYNESEFFIECKFNSKNCSNIQWFFDIFHGSCYRLNGPSLNENERYYQIEGGKFFGLELTVFAGMFFDRNRTIEFQKGYGLYLGIDDQNYVPIVNDNLLNVATGSCTNFNLKKIVSKNLPDPYSNCVDASNYKSVFHKQFERYNPIYTQRTCILFCKQKFINEECNCSTSYFPFLDENKKVCNNAIDLSCFWGKIVKFDLNKNCFDLNWCPAQCEFTSFETYVSMQKFPNPTFEFDQLKTNEIIKEHFNSTPITYDLLSSSLACVNIYFSDISYTSIEEVPSRQMFDLISNVGVRKM
jgi:hypothetical protein